jgi:hypothetical protein
MTALLAQSAACSVQRNEKIYSSLLYKYLAGSIYRTEFNFEPDQNRFRH